MTHSPFKPRLTPMALREAKREHRLSGTGVRRWMSGKKAPTMNRTLSAKSEADEDRDRGFSVTAQALTTENLSIKHLSPTVSGTLTAEYEE